MHMNLRSISILMLAIVATVVAYAYEPRWTASTYSWHIEDNGGPSVVVNGQTWNYEASSSSASSPASLGWSLLASKNYMDYKIYISGWARTGYFIGDLHIPKFL